MNDKDRKKRLEAILKKAYKVFSEQNYSTLTMEGLAKACSITRATLYQLFKNKRDLFICAVNQNLKSTYKELLAIHKSKTLSHNEKLKHIVDRTIEVVIENKGFLAAIISYVACHGDGSELCAYYIRLCRAKLRHLFSTIYIEGFRIGAFQSCNLKHFNTTILGYLNDISIIMATKQENPNITPMRTDIFQLIDLFSNLDQSSKLLPPPDPVLKLTSI